MEVSSESDEWNDPDIEKWSRFIENFQQEQENIPKPFYAVDTLVRKYLQEEAAILDIGCETGKNAACLIKKGHKVTILDIAPNAIHYTKENLRKMGLEQGIVECINGKIEMLDQKYGPFKAVIGTYVFSFIPPHLFQEVMKKNVLGRVENEGYFVGGFFGKEHAWAKKSNLTIVTQEKLKKLLTNAGFTICEIHEQKKEIPTVFNGQQLFHTITVIAKRTLPTETPEKRNILHIDDYL